VLQDALIILVDNIYESWVVDLGASFHGVDTERGVNQYQVQFKNLFQLIHFTLNHHHQPIIT
jgi:hypothetical protein